MICSAVFFEVRLAIGEAVTVKPRGAPSGAKWDEWGASAKILDFHEEDATFDVAFGDGGYGFNLPRRCIANGQDPQDDSRLEELYGEYRPWSGLVVHVHMDGSGFDVFAIPTGMGAPSTLAKADDLYRRAVQLFARIDVDGQGSLETSTALPKLLARDSTGLYGLALLDDETTATANARQSLEKELKKKERIELSDLVGAYLNAIFANDHHLSDTTERSGGGAVSGAASSGARSGARSGAVSGGSTTMALGSVSQFDADGKLVGVGVRTRVRNEEIVHTRQAKALELTISEETINKAPADEMERVSLRVSDEESEKLLALLTVPFLAVSLTLEFFAEGRVRQLIDRPMQVLGASLPSSVLLLRALSL